MAGVLYAIPTPLGGEAADALPARALATARTLRHFVVENAKSARAFLKSAGCDPKEVQILELKEESNLQDVLKPLHEGLSIGLLSEAGCPAIADPGAALVAAAQDAGIRVEPLVGPSSIVLALMASGLEGQRFAFCGYLPREAEERKRKIRELEARAGNPDLHRNALPQRRAAGRLAGGACGEDAALRRDGPHAARREHPHAQRRALARRPPDARQAADGVPAAQWMTRLERAANSISEFIAPAPKRRANFSARFSFCV